MPLLGVPHGGVMDQGERPLSPHDARIAALKARKKWFDNEGLEHRELCADHPGTQQNTAINMRERPLTARERSGHGERILTAADRLAFEAYLAQIVKQEALKKQAEEGE